LRVNIIALERMQAFSDMELLDDMSVHAAGVMTQYT
jgi:hypothetical protein